ncbi:protein SHORT ROOT IN SALT MEDIUM 1 isoform X1 [Rhododendron vialii]|uniref:protein SHORT ROOT IN SALT MEDIUM 1 isoform X1 n=1 Tax=Rhododendron vialii TaxID=182163 RepID=UPI00265F44CD|nr:protein SHORT ROOT IN SALT MEDIUM 1 isoform X1 [Rhododendron vialii]XP_058182730.1 protein SHORT ROOT IN SALT MEDIUM 1 isoform X1 [Rhododendron vialii]XP_058182731.1 protein SHORT ROOT IN SALT MEDIUM 1 isoform X1 [Rhododendron vialii]
MYSSRGGNAYGQQQPYASQSSYSQGLGAAYSGSAVGGPDGGSRHSSMLGSAQESDVTGYRGHSSSGAHYVGQYSSVYGSAALSSGQQVSGMSAKGSGTSALEGRSGYGSAIPDSAKITTGDYSLSSGHGYGHKSDQLYSDKISGYPSVDRHQYGERQSAYAGRDLQNAPAGRFGDSIGFDNQHKADIYDRMDQALLLRQEQMLKAQSLQSASLDGGSRQADYLAARGASIRHSAQDLMSYGGRIDADPRSLSILSGSSYTGQHASSILGAAPRRNMDDLMYAQSSSNPGYGVSLPPGRDYASGKGLLDASLDMDYLRGGHPRIDKDDRVGYTRELERREERRKEHLREREKDRERDKERERERERDRQRKRERERERERILERHDKERDRERERGPEVRRERGADNRREQTPPRISKDRAERLGTSLTKDLPRKDSPHHEALHRRRSPVKEKRREYDCKVYPSSLVVFERDYLSLDKRYPRLFISPECSKVVVNWPRDNLRLSIHTPVSFEHDFVQEDAGAEQKVRPAMTSTEPVKSECATTVWNAKMILMSGLSQNSLEELSSERSYDDRVPHFCNMLRFAVLKKDQYLMAIGGSWDTVDGGDPSVDDSSLVQTVLRYAKDVTKLDLKNCRHWNRFLEIHYDRVGKDGLFSHKEVTVLYVPDLSDCLPSIETWREQWLAHKKAVAERRCLLEVKKEKSTEKKEAPKDKEGDSSKEVKGDDKSKKKLESAPAGQEADVTKKQNDENELKGNAADKDGGEKQVSDKKGGVAAGDKGSSVEKKEVGESIGVPTSGSGKIGRKKIIKKIVKQKVAGKKECLDEKNMGENIAISETTGQQDVPFANAAAVKTFIRKRVVKKVPVAKAVQKDNEGIQPEVKTDKGTECSEDKAKGKSDSSSPAVVQDASVKTTGKKKVIKKVLKRKLTVAQANESGPNNNKDDKEGTTIVKAGKELKALGKKTVDAEASSEKKISAKSVTPAKQDDLGNSNKAESEVVKEEKKAEKKVEEKNGSASKIIKEADKQKISSKDGHTDKRGKSKEREKLKDEEKKDKEVKDDSRRKSSKDVKEKKQLEEPPRHPGLFLQTKGSKESKLRSISLSLDSLLDYTEKDFEESTFELSLFAESLYEMLQYQMGCRLLAFLQKLRVKFVTKRNLRKRQREETSKGSDKKSSAKRLKTDKATVEVKSAKTETQDAANCEDGKSSVKEEVTSVDGVENVKPEYADGAQNVKQEDANGVENAKPEDEMDDDDEDPEEEDPEEEDPEEPEENEEMLDAVPQSDLPNKENIVVGKTEREMKAEKVVGDAKSGDQETPVATSESKPTSGSESKENVEKMETKKSEKPVAVDKELLQAFRFFDRNRVGYVRVEDMRLIIHNLGKFLSYRDVKELVQSALLESNTGRDDHILYNKLVRITDI